MVPFKYETEPNCCAKFKSYDNVPCKLIIKTEVMLVESIGRKFSTKSIQFWNIKKIVFNDAFSVRIMDVNGFDIQLLCQKNCNILQDLMNTIIMYWNVNFPFYDFQSEVLTISEDDISILQERKFPSDDKCLHKKSIEGALQLMDHIKYKSSNIDQLFENLNCKDKYFRMLEYEYFMPDGMFGSSLAYTCLPYFTVIDINSDKDAFDISNLCSLGVRLNRNLRGLIFKNIEFEFGGMQKILSSVPDDSLLRTLELVAVRELTKKERARDKILPSLKTATINNLTRLRLQQLQLYPSALTQFVDRQRNTSLQLRELILDNNELDAKALESLLRMTPKLKILGLNECQLDVAEIFSAIHNASCTDLVTLKMKGNLVRGHYPNLPSLIASLKCLQELDLSKCRENGMKAIVEGLLDGFAKDSSELRKCALRMNECYFDNEVIQSIALRLPNAKRLVALSMLENTSDHIVKNIFKSLNGCSSLTHLEFGYSDKMSAVGYLRGLASIILNPNCSIRKLKIGKGATDEELVIFLMKIRSNNSLESLDISEYPLKNSDAGAIFQILLNITGPFVFHFNATSFKSQTITDLSLLMRRRWPSDSILVPKSIFVCKEEGITILMIRNEIDVDSPLSTHNSQLPLEIRKFNDALLYPSQGVILAQQELNNQIGQLKMMIPLKYIEYSAPIFESVSQAKTLFEEHSKLPTLHIDLLEAALDRSDTQSRVDYILHTLGETISNTLSESLGQMCTRLTDMLNKPHRQAYISIFKSVDELADRVKPSEKFIESMVRQKLETSLRSTIINLNLQLAEMMYTKALNGLNMDVTKSMTDLPPRAEMLPLKTSEIPSRECPNAKEPVEQETGLTRISTKRNVFRKNKSSSSNLLKQKDYSNDEALIDIGSKPSGITKNRSFAALNDSESKKQIRLRSKSATNDNSNRQNQIEVSSTPETPSALNRTPGVDFDSTSSQPLVHIGLNRPKREKRYAPTIAVPGVTSGPVSTEGLFDAPPRLGLQETKLKSNMSTPSTTLPVVPMRPNFALCQGVNNAVLADLKMLQAGGLKKVGLPSLPLPPSPSIGSQLQEGTPEVINRSSTSSFRRSLAQNEPNPISTDFTKPVSHVNRPDSGSNTARSGRPSVPTKPEASGGSSRNL